MYVLFWSNPSCLVGTSNLSIPLPDHIDFPSWNAQLRCYCFLRHSFWPLRGYSRFVSKEYCKSLGLLGPWWDMPQTLQSNVAVPLTKPAATQNYSIWSIKQKRPCELHLSQLLLSFVHFVQACGDNGCIPVGTKIAETSDPSSSASLCFT